MVEKFDDLNEMLLKIKKQAEERTAKDLRAKGMKLVLCGWLVALVVMTLALIILYGFADELYELLLQSGH